MHVELNQASHLWMESLFNGFRDGFGLIAFFANEEDARTSRERRPS
jgi:hypothetical protein